MGRIRKTLAWTLSPGGSMHGLVKPESSAEESARETRALLEEQNRLLQGDSPSPPPPCDGCSRMTTCGHQKTCPQYCVRAPMVKRGQPVYFSHDKSKCGAACRARVLA